MPHHMNLETAVATFLRAQEGKNRRPATLVAYRTDLAQFVAWLRETNGVIDTPAEVTKLDITEYLGHLAKRQLSGVTRARKMASLREFFRYLESIAILQHSPIAGLDTPKKEKHGRNYLSSEEFNRLLAAAGGNPRDYAILQVFLQTGVRVSELCALTLEDIDLTGRTLRVREGKGQADRTIELEKKGIQALKSYLRQRADTLSLVLFLNYTGEPLSERGVQKMLAKYLAQAGITKKISPHALRHTFASYKAARGISAFQLKEWLGHSRHDTTSIYVHLVRQNAKKAMEATSL